MINIPVKTLKYISLPEENRRNRERNRLYINQNIVRSYHLSQPITASQLPLL